MSIVHKGLTLTPLEALVSVIHSTHLERYERFHTYTLYQPIQSIESSSVHLTSVRVLPDEPGWCVFFRYKVVATLRTSRLGMRTLTRCHHGFYLAPRSRDADLCQAPVARVVDARCESGLTAINGKALLMMRVRIELALHETRVEPRTVAEVVFSASAPGRAPGPDAPSR
ncbi:MAG: hypothetical protein AB1446_01315 [Bacillota bacterium]